MAAPPCASHPRAPATTTCAGCGQFLCAPCAEPAPRCARCSGTAHPIPWEDPNLGGATGFWRTLRGLATADAFFVRVPWTGGLARPIAFAALAATIGATASLLYEVLSNLAMGGVLDQVQATLLPALPASERRLLHQMLDQLRGLGPAMAMMTLGLTVLTPFLTAVQLLIISALTHPIARKLGGTGTFEGTLRALAYASGAAVLHCVPGMGGPLATLGQIVLSMVALRRAHGLSSGRAFVAAAWWIPASILLFGALALLFIVQIIRSY